MIRRLAALALCFGALALAATAAGQTHSGTPYQRQVLAAALKGLETHGISVEISDHPKNLGPILGRRRNRELIFSGASDPESRWKDLIAAGVFAARGIGLTWISLPDGSTARYHRENGRFVPATRGVVMRAVSAAALAVGVRVDRIELLHPLRFAPVVTVTVPDRARLRFEKHCGLVVKSLVDYRGPRVEGIFVVARDARGRVFSRGGSAVRLGAGLATGSRFCHG